MVFAESAVEPQVAATTIAPLLLVLIFLLIFAAVILGIIFWIFMLVDAAKREFQNPNDKVVWILVIALVGIIGAAIYYFVIKRKSNCCSQESKPAKQGSKRR